MANDMVLNIIMKASDKASAAFERVKDASSSLNSALLKTQQQLDKK